MDVLLSMTLQRRGYPDNVPQTIKVIDAKGRWAVYDRRQDRLNERMAHSGQAAR
jgi:hypothetical protein